MPEGYQSTIPHRKNIRIVLLRLCRSIVTDSLDEIKEILGPLPLDECTRILTSTIYDHLPLSWAVKHRKMEITRYLLELSSLQGPHERSDGWNRGIHPLVIAMRVNCFRMVFRISRNLHNINDYIGGPYTPIFYAVESMNISYVRLILLLGGDINKPCLNGVSPLMASIFSSKMCSFLLSQNANINHQDDDGNTVLHAAVLKKQIECVKILINSKANIRIRNKDGMTPLMVASANINQQIVRGLYELDEYSQKEKIEALEVLNACSVGYGSPNISYWFQALEMRNPRFPKIRDVPTQKVLDFSREFTTKKKLESLQTDQLKLAFQGILVIDRILGRNNKVYLRLLLQTALIAKEQNNLEKFQQLIDYISQYCQGTPIQIICACSHLFKNIITEIFSDVSKRNILENCAFDLFKIITRTTAEMWLTVKDKFYQTPFVEYTEYAKLADTFLYIASRIRNMNLPEWYKGQFSEVMVQLVKVDPRYINHQSLLHRAIKSTETETWASVELMRLLLESGADVDSKDYFRRTPFIYAIIHGPDDQIREILEMLMEYKCHLDFRDIEGFSAMESRRWASLFIPRSPCLLQCLAVEVILDNQIDYDGALSEGLKFFVDLHS